MTEMEIINKLLEEYPEGVPGNVYRDAIREREESPEEMRMRAKMEKYRSFFADMIALDDDFYDYVIIRVYPKHFVATWEGEFNGLDCSLNFHYAAYTRHPDLSLLHEMIHLHIAYMTDQQKEECRMRLKKDLSEKIPQLDFLLDYCQDYLQTVPQPSHDELFLLKSLDIDLRKKYKLGQSFLYGLMYVMQDAQIYRDHPEKAVNKKILMEKGQK